MAGFMDTWQVQEAKTRFSELLEQARMQGPQIITRHGAERAVVLSVEDYRVLLGVTTPNVKNPTLTGSSTSSVVHD